MKTRLLFLFLTISLFGFSQTGQKTVSQTFDLIASQNVSYFEVTKDMFKMLADSKNTSPEYKEYISKLSGLKMARTVGENRNETGKGLYQLFNSNANLKDYSRLMTKSEPRGKLSFYKKENKSENEFLLVSTDMIIYVTGTIDLKSIGEFEQVMEIAGSAFEM
jgi:cell shape-determining protein MreC